MENLVPRMLIDVAGSIESAYEVTMTPFTYVLDYRGQVLVRGVSNDWRHLESLLDQEGTLESPPGEDVDLPVRSVQAGSVLSIDHSHHSEQGG